MDASSTPNRKRAWRLLLAIGGLGILAAIVYGAGTEAIVTHLLALGWAAPLILLPYAVNALIDGAALGLPLPRSSRISAWRLAALRIAGEAINNITPTAYLGGEPVKVQLMRGQGIGGTDAVAAVVVAKTALVVSQIVFVVSGLVVLLLRLEDASYPIATAIACILGGIAFVVGLVEIQRRGLVALVGRFTIRVFPRSELVARLRKRADEIDARLATLYGRDRRAFVGATALHFAGWIVGVGEVLLICALIGNPIGIGTAYVIESLSGTIGAVSLFVPGRFGVQEAGGVLICQLVGVGPAPAVALMLLKRIREIAFTLLGLLVLARGRRAPEAGRAGWETG